MLVFVILNYKNVNDTIECLESIKKIKHQNDIAIVVVDNNTLNDKDTLKLKKYTDNIVRLDKNLGFAKANNIGCKYAIEKYRNIEFIYVINNDTIINQVNLLELIKRDYDKYEFDLLGPKIITDGGDSVNPFNAYQDINEIKKVYNKNKLLIKIYENRILTYILETYFNIIHRLKKVKHLKNGDVLEVNVALHGCAIIFSKKYLDRYEFPFYNETFLYHEEEFLVYRRNKDNLKFVYDPEIEIFHKEGASLSSSIKNDRHRKLFRYKEVNKSLKKLIDLMEE